MNYTKTSLALFVALMMFTITARTAGEDFRIESIELVDARRISLATILSHMSVGVGDRMTPKIASETIVDLYKTGFFKDVSLLRRENALLIKVKERPAISKVEWDGNSKLKDDNLEEIFDQVGLVSGQIYNDQVLDTLQKELERTYHSQGRYGVKLSTKVTPLPRNRVDIDIEIQEGVASKIKLINIVGNETYSDKEILSEFEMGIPKWYQLFSSKDEYSSSKFRDDIKVLESFYTSRGYLQFKVESVQVTISPNKKDIYVTLNVSEGDLYRVGKVDVSGDTVLNKKKLKEIAERINVTGEYYSSTKTTDTNEYIENRLGGIGYAFAKSELRTDIHEISKTVDLNFVVDSGKRAYVNNIDFKGNEKAQDEVYRRELRQLEGAWYSKALVERSKIRLRRLPYIEEVEVDIENVPGAEDKVNVIYDIDERMAGSFNASAGYSDYYGVTFSVGMQHSNLFGTGNALSVTASSSKIVKSLNFTYVDPYTTEEGVSRSYSMYYTEYDTADTARISYLTNTVGAGMSYQIPLSEFSAIQIGATLKNTEIIQNVQSQIVEINDFVANYGKNHHQLSVPLALVYDTRNRTVHPESGTRQSVGLTIDMPGSDLEYHKFIYSGDYYWDTFKSTVFHLKYQIVYGAGRERLEELPFTDKLSTGGIFSVRGYESRSLGPKATILNPDGSTQKSTYYTLGGDLLTTASIEAIFNPFKKKEGSNRLFAFYDIGNAFENKDAFDSGELRSSFGVGLKWLGPMGAMTFTYAVPINDQVGDEKEYFQFNVGGSF